MKRKEWLILCLIVFGGIGMSMGTGAWLQGEWRKDRRPITLPLSMTDEKTGQKFVRELTFIGTRNCDLKEIKRRDLDPATGKELAAAEVRGATK